MYTIKNLTNSPHRIKTADGGSKILGARATDEFDIHPGMVGPYSRLGYFVVTESDGDGKQLPKREVIKNVQFTEQIDAPSQDEQKEELIAQLAELGIKADKRSSVEKLQEKLEVALAK
ncbi:hypothetical protein Kintu_gp6 [Xanthomonas phage Kintu]